MLNFNYGLWFYKEGIFNIESIEETKLMRKAIKDSKKVEEYFSSILPNIDAIKPIIILSFKLDRNLHYKDRINYITGIIYSKKYIDTDDVFRFANDMATYTDPNDSKSIFFNKGDSENIYGFFEDAFDEDLIDLRNAIVAAYKTSYSINNSNEDEDEDEENDENIIKSENKTVNSATVENGNKTNSQEENSCNEYLLSYYNVTPREKLDNFKNNFPIFVEEMLNRNYVEPIKNNRRRVYIIKGMEDWYNYVMGMLEDAYEINRIEKDYNSLDLTKFI